MDRTDPTRTADPVGEPRPAPGTHPTDLEALDGLVERLAELDPAEVAAPAAELADTLGALLEAAEVDR